MMKETQMTFIHMLFTIVTAVLSAVSYHLSRLGLDTVVDSKLVSHSVALSGAIFAFSVYYYLMQRFPGASPRRKVAYSLVFIIFGVLLVFFSTQFSVITLAEKDAVTTHMQAILQQSDLQGLKLLDRGVREGNLSMHLEDLAENFERYARDEAESGAFSGLEGSGSVVTSLKYVAEQFKSLSQRVQSTEKELSGLYEDLKLAIADARRLLMSDIPIKAMNLNFDRHVSEINDILTRLSHQSSLDYVTQINRNLQRISFTGKERDSAEQKEAMHNLAVNVEAAQEVLNKIMGARRNELHYRGGPFRADWFVLCILYGTNGMLYLNAHVMQLLAGIFGLFIFSGIVAILASWRTEIILNNDEIHHSVQGFSRKHENKIPCHKLEWVQVEQGFLLHLFGIGNIRLRYWGDRVVPEELVLAGMPHPWELWHLIEMQRLKAKEEGRGEV